MIQMLIKKNKKRFILSVVLYIFSNCYSFGQINNDCKIFLTGLDLIEISINDSYIDVVNKFGSELKEEKSLNDSIKIITVFNHTRESKNKIMYEISFNNSKVFSFNFKIFDEQSNRKQMFIFFKESLKRIVESQKDNFINNLENYSFYENNNICVKSPFLVFGCF